MRKLNKMLLATIFGAALTYGNASLAIAQAGRVTDMTVTVLSVNGATATVRADNGQTVRVDTSALGTQLPVGETITLHGSFNAAGTFIANRIVSGSRQVTDLSATILNANGAFESARLDNGRTVQIDTTALHELLPIGETGVLHGYFNPAGTFIATGVVSGYRRTTDISATILGVNGTMASARVDNGRTITVDMTVLHTQLPVDETLVLHGYFNAAGTFIATSVKSGYRHATDITGSVLGTQGTMASVRVNNGQVVRVDTTPLHTSLPVGHTVTLHGYFDSAGTFVASSLVKVF